MARPVAVRFIARGRRSSSRCCRRADRGHFHTAEVTGSKPVAPTSFSARVAQHVGARLGQQLAVAFGRRRRVRSFGGPLVAAWPRPSRNPLGGASTCSRPPLSYRSCFPDVHGRRSPDLDIRPTQGKAGGASLCRRYPAFLDRAWEVLGSAAYPVARQHRQRGRSANLRDAMRTPGHKLCQAPALPFCTNRIEMTVPRESMPPESRRFSAPLSRVPLQPPAVLAFNARPAVNPV
jgi:hypothetical protein